MRKREAFAGIFAPNFKKACEFLTKNSRGAFSPEVFIEHFNACIILRNGTKLKFCQQLSLPSRFAKGQIAVSNEILRSKTLASKFKISCIKIQAKMRKRKAFAGIFAPNFKRECGFLE